MTTAQQPSVSSSMVTLRLPSHILKNLPTPTAAAGAVSTPSSSSKKRSTAAALTATPKPSAVSSPAPPDDDQAKTTKGPKGNAGPMNAQLRALDRSGAPTRKWIKHPIPFKSFSGFSYTLNCWSSVTPKTDNDNENDNDDNGDQQQPEIKKEADSIKSPPAATESITVNPTPTPAPEETLQS